MPQQFQRRSVESQGYRLQNKNDLSEEYYNRIKTNQKYLARANSTTSKTEPRHKLPDSIAGLLFPDINNQYDLFSRGSGHHHSNARKTKHSQGTRSLGLNTDRYDAVLDNGPWELLRNKTEKSRREAARNLIEEQLRKRQKEKALGVATGLPKLSTECTLFSSGIAVEKKNEDHEHEGNISARDLFNAPLVATKTVVPSPPKNETPFRLPLLKKKNKVKVKQVSTDERNQKLKEQVKTRLTSTRLKSPERQIRPLSNPNWVTVITAPSPTKQSEPFSVLPTSTNPSPDIDLPSTSPARSTPDTFFPELWHHRESLVSESRSEIAFPLLDSIAESPEVNSRDSSGYVHRRSPSGDQPKSILKQDSQDALLNGQDDGKRVRFLQNEYLERVRLYHTSSKINTPVSKPTADSTGQLSVPTNLLEQSAIPSWRPLATIIKCKTRIKRKRKKRTKSSSAKHLSSRPDSPRPEFLSGEKPKELADIPAGLVDEEQQEGEKEESQFARRRRQNQGDGYVIELKLDNGDLVEKKVEEGGFSDYVTSAELSYRINEILGRPVFGRTPTPPAPTPATEQENSPRMTTDTAFRRRSQTRPTCSPFLAPELREPVHSPFVSACVSWNAATSDSQGSGLDDSDESKYEISPLLIAMRDCRYIRWTKKDEVIVQGLHNLEDQLVEGPGEEDLLCGRTVQWVDRRTSVS